MQGFLGFIVNEVLSQPAVIAGLMALIGLVALRKPARTVLTGTLKTIIGFLILGVGADVITSTLNPLGTVLQEGFGINGVIPNNEAIVALAVDDFGRQTAIIMSLGFVFNLVFARLTPLKYVFLTGHHTFFMACLISAVLTTAGMGGGLLILVGSVILGFLMVAIPALGQPFMRRITGDDNIAIGHFGTVGYVASALVGKWFGNPEKSTEEVKVPKGFGFLRDTTVSTALTMVVIYVFVVLSAGPDASAGVAGGQNYIAFAVLQGLMFAVGLYVILAGVRMMLAEIVPAFQGIAEKIVPDAKPALDCPVTFNFAPTAVIIGFLSSFLGGLIGLGILAAVGATVIIPGLVPHFFTGATAGVFGNATGGRRGAFLGALANGLLISFLPALLLPVLGDLGFQNTTFGDADFAVVGIVIGFFASLFQ
ncbi:PTS ascorbate transporter subunit IIC [Novibacillus thermophilus]|uniref:Ascorbate-specific PTS system EIIC component n=1 Tax=Novibacillus thermophilus TaxID=1471761 RepID=A0A1U9K865_9BACL|nr:PTS ascorbate transporter subunit IIC [Novibacillus thermophilus]AQS56257.1 PTS ascorbate transporter subunit IIC [Novibacillus thermophilus]